MAAKTSTRSSGFRCSECGWTTVKWVGRCGECQAWGSVSEIGAVTVRTTAAARVERPAVPIGQVDARRAEARSTGVGEFDRVLGGGLVPGAVVLVAGEPGIGKSTLLLDVAARAARRARAAPSSTSPARSRPPRCGCGPSGSRRWPRPLFLAAETDLATVLGQIDAVQPDLVVVDSVQTIASGEVEGVGRQRQPGPRGRRLADPGGQGPRHRHPAGRPRHQGRLDRRAPGARAPGRRGRAVRGRPALAAAAGPGGQEPLRPHRRGRLLRPVRRRHRRACPTPAGCSSPGGTLDRPGHLRHRHPRGPPAADDRGAGAGRQERDPHPATRDQRARLGPGRDDHRRARPARRGADRQRRRLPLHRRRGPADRARLRPRGRPRRGQRDQATGRCADHAIAFGELGLAGELRPVTGIPRRLAEAARLGFRTAYVPPGCCGSGPIPEGMQRRGVRRHPHARCAPRCRPAHG